MMDCVLQMAAFVAKFGPVSIALDDMPQLWFPYKGGVMTGCCDKTATHAVLIVGYGVENATKYWIIKNRCDFSTFFGALLGAFCCVTHVGSTR